MFFALRRQGRAIARFLQNVRAFPKTKAILLDCSAIDPPSGFSGIKIAERCLACNLCAKFAAGKAIHARKLLKIDRKTHLLWDSAVMGPTKPWRPLLARTDSGSSISPCAKAASRTELVAELHSPFIAAQARRQWRSRSISSHIQGGKRDAGNPHNIAAAMRTADEHPSRFIRAVVFHTPIWR